MGIAREKESELQIPNTSKIMNVLELAFGLTN